MQKKERRLSIYKHFIKLFIHLSFLLVVFLFFMLLILSNSSRILEFLLYPAIHSVNNYKNIYFISSNLFELLQTELMVIYDTALILFSPFLFLQIYNFLFSFFHRKRKRGLYKHYPIIFLPLLFSVFSLYKIFLPLILKAFMISQINIYSYIPIILEINLYQYIYFIFFILKSLIFSIQFIFFFNSFICFNIYLYRKYVILVIFLLTSLFISDIISQFVFMIFFILLYESIVLICFFYNKKK